MLSQELSAALAAQRVDLNARFRALATLHPHLERERFTGFVRDCIDPLIVGVHRHDPQAVHAVLTTAYDSGLQLVAARVTEHTSHHELIRYAWRDTLSSIPQFVAADPARVIASVNNALLQIAATDAQAAMEWLREVSRLSAHCETAGELLQCGQVLAWKGGLAHFRSSALELLRSMRDSLVAAIFTTNQPAADLREQLAMNRWFHPQRSSGKIDVLAKIGAFRGFGGAFIEPPLIAAHADGWVIRSGAEYWYLIADAFGHSLHRATAEEWRHAEQSGGQSRVHFVGTRLIQHQLELADAGPITSAAAWSDAIACTTALSHQVIIVAPQ